MPRGFSSDAPWPRGALSVSGMPGRDDEEGADLGQRDGSLAGLLSPLRRNVVRARRGTAPSETFRADAVVSHRAPCRCVPDALSQLPDHHRPECRRVSDVWLEERVALSV